MQKLKYVTITIIVTFYLIKKLKKQVRWDKVYENGQMDKERNK